MSLSVNAPTSAKVNNAQPEVNTKEKTKIVYVSKTPDRAANAAGVIAGTSGMVGGAVLGGLVGLCKLPGELLSTIAGQKYEEIIVNSLKGLKTGIKDSKLAKDFAQTFHSIKTPEAAESLIQIAGTLSERLHTAFKDDAAAASVIDSVIDPFVNALSVKKNFRSYISGGVKHTIESPVGLAKKKINRFNKKTSKIVGDITGHAAEGITQAVVNIQNFTPEQREAWGRVCSQIGVELENNKLVKNSKAIVAVMKEMAQDASRIKYPLENFRNTIVQAGKDLNKGLGRAPIKTIGKWSAIGAAACGAVSTLGWLGFKKTIMKKEEQKLEAAEK